MEKQTKKQYKFYKINSNIEYIGTFTEPKNDIIKNSQFISINSKDGKYAIRLSLRFANTHEGKLSTSFEVGTIAKIYEFATKEELGVKVEALPKIFDFEEFTPTKREETKNANLKMLEVE